MSISLSKGQRVDLTKTNPGLTEVLLGLGWDTQRYDGSSDFDIDASVFLVGANGQCRNEKDFIFYNNLQSADGSVRHLGDNLTGAGDGDDEQVSINLKNVPSDVERIVFTVTIHEANERNQNFGQINNAFVRLVNQTTNTELMRFDLGEDFSIETAVVFAELYRHGTEWKFNAIGAGYQGGLNALVNQYGL